MNESFFLCRSQNGQVTEEISLSKDQYERALKQAPDKDYLPPAPLPEYYLLTVIEEPGVQTESINSEIIIPINAEQYHDMLK